MINFHPTVGPVTPHCLASRCSVTCVWLFSWRLDLLRCGVCLFAPFPVTMARYLDNEKIAALLATIESDIEDSDIDETVGDIADIVPVAVNTNESNENNNSSAYLYIYNL